MGRRSTKLKNMTPERVAKYVAARRFKAMNDVADKIDLPEAQRGVGGIRWDEKTAIVDGFNRPTDRTARGTLDHEHVMSLSPPALAIEDASAISPLSMLVSVARLPVTSPRSAASPTSRR